MCAILPNPGASSGEAGIWGKDPRGSQTGYRLKSSNCDAKPACVAVREPRPLSCANRPAGIPPNERGLAHGERSSRTLCQPLFRVDIQVAFDAQCKNIPQRKPVPPFHGRQAHSVDSPKNESAPDSLSVTGRPSCSQPPYVLTCIVGMAPTCYGSMGSHPAQLNGR
jgi:hypothetical protein